MRLLIVILAILVLPDSIFAITFSARFTKDGKPLTRAIIDFVSEGQLAGRLQVEIERTKGDAERFLKGQPSGRIDLKHVPEPTVRVITDDDGRCVVRGIPEGFYFLFISYRNASLSGEMRIPCPNGRYDKLDVSSWYNELCGTKSIVK